MTRVCVLGASGRMGTMLIAGAEARDDIELAAAVDHPESKAIGSQVGHGITVSADIASGLGAADVYIDFTTPEATTAAALAAHKPARAAVIGTTGLDDRAEAAIGALAEVAPVLVASNFSLGVQLLLTLAETAARALPNYDLEVVELHHRRKRDAPSGTAISIAKALAAGRGLDYESCKRESRSGDVGPRTDDEIGVVAVRGGDIVGEHTAYLIGEVERIELTHRASSRSVFADGALTAARWLASKTPGRYTMKDVLGL